MDKNKLICLTCEYSVILSSDHPANKRAHDGIVYRASCEKCKYVMKQKAIGL